MKKLKNNWWNRLFHSKKVKANGERIKQLHKIIEWAPKFLTVIGDVSYQVDNPNTPATITGVKTLLGVYNFHKEAWVMGFRNKELGPSEGGMFRTKDMRYIEPSQIFLGGIYNLPTENIPFWEEHKKDSRTSAWPICGYLTDYEIVLQQYKQIFCGNIVAIKTAAEEEQNLLIALGY